MKFCWIVLHIKQYQTTCNSLDYAIFN